MSSSRPVLLPRSPHHTRRTTFCIPSHPLQALAYPPPLHLFLREKDRREGRRTTESRCGPFIVLRLSFVRQRTRRELTFISSYSLVRTRKLDIPLNSPCLRLLLICDNSTLSSLSTSHASHNFVNAGR